MSKVEIAIKRYIEKDEKTELDVLLMACMCMFVGVICAIPHIICKLSR